MADLREEYGTGRGRQTDEYGNPVHTGTGVDELGKPIYSTGTVGGHGGATRTGHTGTGVTGTGVTGTGTGGQGQLRRSGSSSSSSSEEDEHGVRRKKGLKEKIKEKLPGGGHKETGDPAAGTYGTTTEQYGTGQEHEKKGMMEKIKEKLPGAGGGHQQTTGHTTAGTLGTGYGTGTHGTEYGATTGQDPHEKKGMMEKIKEKMPGTGHKEY